MVKNNFGFKRNLTFPTRYIHTFAARKMDNKKHYLAAIGSFVMWGTFSLALKAMDGFLPSTILYFRILISVIILIGLFAIVRRKTIVENLQTYAAFPNKKKWKLGVLTITGGLLLAINWLVFIHVINHVSIKTASFSYFMCPVLTAVLAYLFLKEKLSVIQWISVLICAVSCMIIGRNSLQDAGYSLIIAASYAFYIIVQRNSQELDKLVVLLFQIGTALLIITPFYGYLVPETPTDYRFYLGTAGIALFFTVLPLNMQLFALQRLKSATIGILMYINPFMNFLIAVLVFHERISVEQGIGYGLILIAVFMFNWNVIRNRVSS